MATETGQRHVLAINDSVEILALYRELLEGEGHRVSLSSVALGLDEVRGLDPDLVVLDVVFGGEHLGLELLQQLRMDRATATVPVVVCSAALEAIRQMEGHLLGKGVGLVLKPFDGDELLAEIDHAWGMVAEQGAPVDRVVAFPQRAHPRARPRTDGPVHAAPDRCPPDR